MKRIFSPSRAEAKDNAELRAPLLESSNESNNALSRSTSSGWEEYQECITKILTSCFAVLILYFFLWPFASVASMLWVAYQPFERFDWVGGEVEFVERIVTLPRRCGYVVQSAVLQGRPLAVSFFESASSALGDAATTTKGDDEDDEEDPATNGPTEALDVRAVDEREHFPWRCLYRFLWAHLLLFVVWPLACMAISPWMLFQPFEPFFVRVRTMSRWVERIVTWPKKCGRAMFEGSDTFPHPLIEN